MNYEFKVGDKVRILDGSKIPDYMGGWCMNDDINKIATIKKRIDYDDLVGYRMNELACIYDARGLELIESNIEWVNIRASEVFDNLKRGNEVIAIILEDNDKYTRGVYDLDTIQVNALIDLLEGENIEFYYKEV